MAQRGFESDWANRLGPECGYYEALVAQAAGRSASIVCDGARSRLVVTVPGLDGEQVDLVVDLLATLWPCFLAPAGVSLVVNGSARWDHGAMALRYRARLSEG